MMKNRTIRGRRRRQAAFSLIELLLVLVILAVLASMIVPKFAKKSEQARVTAAKQDISSLSVALDTFEIENGKFPSTEEGLGVLLTQPSWAENWTGPYIKGGTALPKDAWGNPYEYRFPGSNNVNSYDMWSLGPDGREGNDDITNWSRQ
jgi:general secretion pathway protein G